MKIITPIRLPWILVAIMVAINLGLLGYMALGEPQRSAPPQSNIEKQQRLIAYFQESIDLDQVQVDRFSELWEAFHVKAQEDRRENRKVRDQLHQAVITPARNQAEVDSLLTITATRVVAHERYVMEHFDRLSEVCRPEQRSKFGKAFVEMMKKGPGGGGERPGPDGPRRGRKE